MSPPPRLRVLVVDDSALARQVLSRALSTDPAIDVVGTAGDPFVAQELIQALRPDVLTLDVEMPGMDGLTFLDRLMRVQPLPVIMVSSLTEAGAATTLAALERGAVDFVAKPQGRAGRRPEWAAELVAKVRSAAGARNLGRARPSIAPDRPSFRASQGFVVMGASTGGTEALREILGALPPTAPPIAIVQHMPEKFTRAFADRLDRLSALAVREAQDGDLLEPGHVLLAPGGHHLMVARDGVHLRARVSSEEPVNRHRPSVDVLFESATRVASRHTIAVLLTGMGNDGARGLLALRRAGARTVAQDEATSVVFGMPREAIALGAAEHVAALADIPGLLARLSDARLSSARGSAPAVLSRR